MYIFIIFIITGILSIIGFTVFDDTRNPVKFFISFFGFIISIILVNLFLPVHLDDEILMQYVYYQIIIEDNKVEAKEDLEQIEYFNERIKNGKNAQDNWFFKYFNRNHEWSKLNELDEDKAYQSYVYNIGF